MFTGKKSLRLASGLLALCLYLLYASLPVKEAATGSAAIARNVKAHEVNALTGENYWADVIGKLFPVLKSLNLM